MQRVSMPMRRLALLLVVALLLPPLSSGCAGGGRDAHDIAADLEGTVSTSSVDRLLRDVDLSKASVTVSIDHADTQTFGPADQQALESYLRDAATGISGDRVHVTQQVVDDTGANTQQLTVTLEVVHEGATQYIPLAIDLVRDGRRMLVTRVRVMAPSH
jgi:hypothetical protein